VGLRGERTEGRELGIDRDGQAAVPDDADVSALVDVGDDAPVARAEPGAVGGVMLELDSRPDRDTRSDAGSEKACAEGIHECRIGSSQRGLEASVEEGSDPLSAKSEQPADRSELDG
jgi:hypothetical protein